MCGTIKHEGVAKKMGNIFRIYPAYAGSVAWSSADRHWSGFMQFERADWWKTKADCFPVVIPATSFSEGKYELHVPGGMLAGYLLDRPIILNGRCIAPGDSFKIVTRGPISDFEKKVHNRWPYILKGSSGITIWTEKEILNANSRHGQLPLL